MPNIRLPDGRIIKNVPQGTTKEDLTKKLIGRGVLTGQEDFIQKDRSLLSKIGTATVEGLAGFTEGLGRAAVGATQLGAELLGQKEFAGRIGEQVEREKELEKDQPTARKVGRFIGQIAPALPVGAGAGLIAGGIRGGAAAELIQPTQTGTAEERVKQTAIGAGLGGLTGGASLGAGKAIKGTAGVVKRQFKATKPEDIIAKGIRADDAQPLLDQLQQGKEVIIPDVAGDEIRGLTRSIAKLPQAKDVITDALEGRSFKAIERVSNQLAKDISPIDSYFGNLDDLAKARSEIATPLYKKAFEKGTTLDINKNKALFEKIAPDIADAKKKFRLGDDIKDNSIVILDAAKKSLDDKIGKAIRQGERQEARALQGIKSELVSKLDELNPDYKKARRVFSDFATIQNAQEQGLQFTKLRPEEISRTLKGMTPAEKDGFRIGVRESLDKVVQKTPFGADPAKRIFGNSEIRNKVKVAIGDDVKFNKFKSRLEEEIAGADTKFKVLGGSRSDFNLSGDDQFLDKLASGAEMARGNKSELLRTVVTSLKNRAAGLNKKNAKQVAEILVDRDRGIEALQIIINKEQSATQKRVLQDFIRSLRPEVIGSQAIQENN